MPLHVERIIGEVRLDCNNPDAHAPSDDQIVQKIADCAQMLANELANQQPSWSLEIQLIPAGLFDKPYRLNFPSLGKPTRLHTYDPSNPQRSNEPLTLVRPQELTLPSNSETGERQAAFHYPLDGMPYLQVQPPFLEPTALKLWYETGELPELTLNSNPLPVMPQFHRYLRTLVDLEVLGFCEWTRLLLGKDLEPFQRAKLFDTERARLLPVLAAKEQRERQSWNIFIATGFQDGDGGCRPYAAWMEECW